MFKKVQTITLSKIDDKTVLFLKDYTCRAIENLQGKLYRAQNQGKKVAPEQEDGVYFDLSIFWKVAQDLSQ